MDIQKRLIDFVSDWSPWLATVPTAWTVGISVYNQFHWPWPVAGSAGVSIEFLGLACTALMLYLFELKTGEHSTTADTIRLVASVVFSAVYFAAVIFLTAVLEQNWALATFPVLSLVATANLALRSSYKLRVAQIEQESADEKAEADRIKAEKQAERERIKAEKQAAKAAKATTDIEQPIAAVAEFVCPKCGKKLSKQVSLDAHLEWHARTDSERMPI